MLIDTSVPVLVSTSRGLFFWSSDTNIAEINWSLSKLATPASLLSQLASRMLLAARIRRIQMHFSSLAHALGPKDGHRAARYRSMSLDRMKFSGWLVSDVEGKNCTFAQTRWRRVVDTRYPLPAPDTNSLSLISARSKTEDAATLCRIFGFAIASRVGLSALREAAR